MVRQLLPSQVPVFFGGCGRPYAKGPCFHRFRALALTESRRYLLPEKYKNVEAGREVFVMNRQKRLENDVRFW